MPHALTRTLVGEPPADRPKYVWLKDVLRDYMDHHLAVGALVPSERELSDQLGVSRMTARRALDELMAEGRVHREVGRGTFVSAPTIRLPIQLTSFTQDMTARGFTPGSETLSSSEEPADDAIVRWLDVRRGDPVFRFERLRSADQVPMAIERVHLAADLAPGLLDLDLEESSLYELLARHYDIVFDGGEEIIRARTVSGHEARLLDVPDGAAVLHLIRTSTWRGRTVEFTVSSYRADRYELSTLI